MKKEITIKLTIPQARAAWLLLTGVEEDCDDHVFFRSCETGARRIAKAINRAGKSLFSGARK
jgi:hypothetical protein